MISDEELRRKMIEYFANSGNSNEIGSWNALTQRFERGKQHNTGSDCRMLGGF